MALVCGTLALLLTTACPDQPQGIAPAPAPTDLASRADATAIATGLKQEAILGTVSRLQLMAMQQSGASVTAAPPSPASAPALSDRPQAAVMSLPLERPFQRSWLPASPDRPNIFGSSAVPVARTSLDAKWHRVSVNFSQGIPATRQLAGSTREDDVLARLEAVNSWVNRHVQFMSDLRSTGKSDVWSSAAETLSRGRGDCEDYAIAKLQILKGLGFAADDLYLAVVRDLVRRADHAILVVRVSDRFVVLDNNIDRVRDSAEIADYRPVITYAASGKAFLHGYQQPVRVASVSVSPAAN